MEPKVNIQISQDQLSLMSKQVERALALSLKALFEQDVALAYNVIDSDKAINSYEIDIDNSTFAVLAVSHLPSAMLRQILAIQKINAMLERIGDHAVNIAESAINLANMGRERELLDLPKMATLTTSIFKDALASFFEMDLVMAQNVLVRDEEIDSLNVAMTGEVKSKVLCGDTGDMSIERAMEIIRVCKNLERIADLSTNIAEETSFATIGKIVKHHHA
jgi:phosphate transport system protein